MTLPLLWAVDAGRRLWLPVVLLAVLYIVETPIAHEDADVMAIFVAVVLIDATGKYWLPIVATLTATAMFLPPLVASWNQSINWPAAISIPLVAGIMFGFFMIAEANRELVANVVRHSRANTFTVT